MNHLQIQPENCLTAITEQEAVTDRLRRNYQRMKHAVVEQTLTMYSYLPYHPGKGTICQRFFPYVSSQWETPRTRSRFGIRFQLDLRDKISREIYYYAFSPRDMRALHRLVGPSQHIFDVGAHIGYFSLLFAKWVGRRGSVNSFEPCPKTRERLLRNSSLNPKLQQRMQIHEVGLSDHDGYASMISPDATNSGCNYIGSGGGDIKITTLDHFVECNRISRMDLIKVDVEGSECALLEGARETIRRFRPRIVIEVNASTLRRSGKEPVDLLEQLRAADYNLYVSDRWGRLNALDRVPGIGEEPNVYAIPRV
jgi:FkbM family methyltransferase